MENTLHHLFSNTILNKLLFSIFILIIIITIVRILTKTLHTIIEDNARFYRARKTLYFIATMIYLAFMSMTWLHVAEALTTYLGLLSAGIAVGLKDTLVNIAGWFFIVIKRPFKVGDRIFIQGQRGDVIDIRLFQFSLIQVSNPEDGEQSTGCIIDIPNHYIFLYPIINAVKGFSYIWNEINVELTFESDWQYAKEKLFEILNQHTQSISENAKPEIQKASKNFMIYYNNYTPIIYTTVSDSGVIFSLRYLCTPKEKRQTSNDIWEDILILCQNEASINLAYPTRRVVS